MITKYKIGFAWSLEAVIESVQVVRETEKFVFLLNLRGEDVREAKKGSFHEYFDTWEAAHRALMDKAEHQLLATRRSLTVIQSKHGNIRGMKKP